MDAVGFDSLLKETDIVFTGEGRIDWQSTRGKVPVGVARRAQAAGVPCIALCGSVGKGAEQVYDYGITAVFSSIGEICDFEQVKKHCAENLRVLSDAVMRVLTAGESLERRRRPMILHEQINTGRQREETKQ